jgi:hypothetical protein
MAGRKQYHAQQQDAQGQQQQQLGALHTLHQQEGAALRGREQVRKKHLSPDTPDALLEHG